MNWMETSLSPNSKVRNLMYHIFVCLHALHTLPAQKPLQIGFRSDTELYFLKTKDSKDVGCWVMGFQQDNIHDEYYSGHNQNFQALHLTKMTKISDKLDCTLLERNYHLAALSSCHLVCPLICYLDTDHWCNQHLDRSSTWTHRTNVQSIIGEALWGLRQLMSNLVFCVLSMLRWWMDSLGSHGGVLGLLPFTLAGGFPKYIKGV